MFLDKLFDAKGSEFEVLLYNEIRSLAQSICAPQINRSDSSVPEIDAATESESKREQYAQLEMCLFNNFERYISGPTLSKCDSGWNQKLEVQINGLGSNEPRSCGHIFQANEPVYCCR